MTQETSSARRGEPLLSVSGLCKRYGAVTVVSDVSFDLAAGEAIGVLGPNGAGKTTLLKMIGGTVAANAGTVTFQGQDLTRLSAEARCRAGLVRTNQVPAPFSLMTVWENALVAASHGGALSRRAAEDRAHEALLRTGLLDRHHSTAGGLSLMGRKRLELSRALACGPKALLLDEIAGGLSDYEVKELIDLIAQIRASGVAIIWIEHIVHALMSSVSRLIALDFGNKIADGAPRDVIESEAFRRAYFGDSIATAELA
ncbi:ABC transporter ATP-binding protein [Phaeobacter sp. HF9A]|uniref:ABC transporter ATP-binding protein n=1 Tax=Phaeobacter sp. HF9A TaxID=2721561 RepID=UPI0014320B0D|nr:ATP-binding cassette domain-containing protein [Phaeobacter sp. HF9A]NIZ13569.1 ATP-binding cassette domain-containing protein [Phaeobacter sp. HF9A]